MKKTFYFISVLLIIICAACGKPTKEKLVGTWKVKSVAGTILTANEIETVITINADGKWQSKMGADDSSSGIWALSDDEKKVKSVFTDETDTTIWNIVSLDDKQFIYTVDKDTTKITLEKLKEKN